jgi:hypothetical protein
VFFLDECGGNEFGIVLKTFSCITKEYFQRRTRFPPVVEIDLDDGFDVD